MSEALKDLASYLAEKLGGKISESVLAYGELTLTIPVDDLVNEGVDGSLAHRVSLALAWDSDTEPTRRRTERCRTGALPHRALPH